MNCRTGSAAHAGIVSAMGALGCGGNHGLPRVYREKIRRMEPIFFLEW
jgi:hypothetical protein